MTRDEEIRELEACRRLGDDQARVMRHLSRASSTPEQRRETKRENRRDLRRRWQEWQERVTRRERGW